MHMRVSTEEAVRFPKVYLLLTMMTPVSLLAIMMEMRQVFGRTAAMTSSTSTRAVTLDTGTNVTSVRDKSRNILRLVGNSIFFFWFNFKLLLKETLQDGLLPAWPSFCRCSATSLTETCSTLEVIMWGRPLLLLCCPSPCSWALQFLLKYSTAVWSTRLLAWKKVCLTWTTAACMKQLFCRCSRVKHATSNDYLCSTWCENYIFCFTSHHPRHILSGLINYCLGFSTYK